MGLRAGSPRRAPGSTGLARGGERGSPAPSVLRHMENEWAGTAAPVLQESIPLQEQPGCSSLRSPRSLPPSAISLSNRCCLLPCTLLFASLLSRTVPDGRAAVWGCG